MAELDPNKPQVTDPVTVAGLARVLSVRGALGVLDVADIIVPVISVGSLAPLEVAIRSPAFRSTDVFSAGLQTNQAINTVLADTGALTAGTFDITMFGSTTRLGAGVVVLVQHRDAANAANLMTYTYLFHAVAGVGRDDFSITFGYEFAANERLRILQGNAGAANEGYVATIFARIR